MNIWSAEQFATPDSDTAASTGSHDKQLVKRDNNPMLSDDAVSAAASFAHVSRLSTTAYPPELDVSVQPQRESMVQLLTGASAPDSFMAHLVGAAVGSRAPACQEMGGSFQGLLNSFHSGMPAGLHMGGHAIARLPETTNNTGEVIVLANSPDETAVIQGSPAMDDVDETGYESSESSVYYVDSDNEDYSIDCAFGSIDECNFSASPGCQDGTDHTPTGIDDPPSENEEEATKISSHEMYARWSERRWRHFLPADFALAAFRGEGCVATDGVKEMFLNYHITYNVGECRLVMAPILLHWHWCLYVWDFERKVMVVLDTMSMPLGEQHMAEKHRHNINIMHGALTASKKLYFPHPSESMEDWKVEFFSVQGAHGDSKNSGLYALFYARYFDGKYLTRILTPEATKVQKCNLLCQLLTMFGNIGQPPPSIKAAITGAY